MKAKTDFKFNDGGSIILLHPLTEKAQNWICENVYYEPWQKFGNGIGIEPRLFEVIFTAIQNENLTISN